MSSAKTATFSKDTKATSPPQATSPPKASPTQKAPSPPKATSGHKATSAHKAMSAPAETFSWERKMCAAVIAANRKKFRKILDSKEVTKRGNLARGEWARDEAPLHAAAFWGDDKAVAALVAAGVLVDSVEVHGDGSRFTALHRAALANLPETVRLLLKLRADAALVGKYWEKAPGSPQQQGLLGVFYAGSALDFARQRGRQEVARLLEAHLGQNSAKCKKAITLEDVRGKAAKERELREALAVQDLVNAQAQLLAQLRHDLRALEGRWNAATVEVLALKARPGYRSERQIHLLSQHLERLQTMASALKDDKEDEAAVRSRSCPVCFEAPAQVFSCLKCENWVCGRCKDRLEACPSCRDNSEPPKRNKGIERVLGL